MAHRGQGGGKMFELAWKILMDKKDIHGGLAFKWVSRLIARPELHMNGHFFLNALDQTRA
jgi:hypothetical protein